MIFDNSEKFLINKILFFYFSYKRLLRRAQNEDLSEVSGIGCLYQSGYDRQGRPVIVFLGKWFPPNNLLDKVGYTLNISL